MDLERELKQIDESIDKAVSAASAGYSCWQQFTVRTIHGGESVQGCIPLITLPASLVGKTVKVTIEEVM